MKNKLKRILGVITAISLLLQMSFVITSNAAEYLKTTVSISISNLQIQTEVEHEMHTIPSILTLRQRKMVKQLSNLTSI